MSIRLLYSFPTRLGVPGIGTTAWYQVQGLAELGVRVSLYCGSLERPLRGVERVIETMHIGPIPLPYRAMGLNRAMAWHDRRVARALLHDPDAYDVVHCWPSGALATLIAAKSLGIKTLLERPNAHTAFAFRVVQDEYKKLKLPVPPSTHKFDANRLAREEAEFAKADHLACPSEFVARTFREEGFSPDRLLFHQYGYDEAVFTPAARTRSAAGLQAAFVGSCEPRKGLHYALQAWTRSAACTAGTFHICGRFVAGYREALADLLKHPSIREHGFVADVASVMRQCDLLVLPTIEEGSALVTYEARACGCVLVVSDAAGARCSHMVDGLIHPAGDVEALTAHLSVLATRPDLCEKLRSASIAGLPDLTWSAAANRLVQVYDRVRDGCEARSSAPGVPVGIDYPKSFASSF